MFVLRPLARRPIALLWTGQVLAATGSEFYMVAVVWIAAGLIGADAGYVSALQAAALLVGSLFSGALTDRWRHGPTMIAADLTRAGLLLCLSLASLAHLMSLPLLIGVAGAVAMAASAFDPALQASLPVLAAEPELRHAVNGLFDLTRRMARVLGPSLIAVASGFLPMGQFFTVTALAFLLSAAAVRAVAADLPSDPPRGESRGLAGVMDGVFGGVRAVRGHAVAIYGMVSGMISMITWSGGVILGMALFLRQTRPHPLTDYSLMMTVYGLGNLASNLVLASIRPRHPLVWLVISKLVFGLGVLTLPLAPSDGWRMAIAGLAALNGPFENLAMLHLMQRDFPLQRLAQVYRLQMCANFLGVTLAYLAAPTLFRAFGYAPVIMGLGAGTLASGGAGVWLLLRGRAEAADLGARRLS